MAIRTTEVAVAAIVEVDDTISLLPFIEVASRIVTKVCTSDDLEDEDLELIERWLSAHFYKLRDQAIASEGVGKLSQSFQYKIETHLASTMYGQAAMDADTSGALAAYNREQQQGAGRRTVSVLYLGKTRCEVEPEECC